MWQFLVSSESLFWSGIVSLTTLKQGYIYILSQLISSRVSFLLNLIMKNLTCKWNVNCNVTKFQARIHPGFHRFTEIGQSFFIIYFNKKKLFKLQDFIQGKWNWPISCLNDSETQEKGLKGVKLNLPIPISTFPRISLKACAFGARSV